MRIKFFALIILTIFISSTVLPVKAQSQDQYPVYIVQSGDTLLGIANLFGISLESLESINNITDPNLVGVGTRLYIPGLQGVQGVLTTFDVQLGESLNSLSVKYQIDPDFIEKINRITSPNEIYVGSTLILPYSEESNSRIPVAKVDSFATVLEIAALNNTTSWDILDQNGRNKQTSILPNDLVYLMSKDSLSKISAVYPKLSEVTINPLPLVQGNTFEIIVDSPIPVTLQGSLNEMPLNFFTLEGNKQVALQGIHAMAEPGLAPFTLSGTFDDGTTFAFDQSILLLSGNYPTSDPLIVDPALIDPAVMGPEEEEIKNLVSVATPSRHWSGIFTRPGFYDEYNTFYGERRSYNNGAYSSFHSGVDFAGGEGLPIASAADGIVVFAGKLQVRGNATIIDHGWGVYTAYYHQSEIDVKKGDIVTAGQIIGKVGNTGRVDNSEEFQGAGAHLHWEIWVNGIQVDPIEWLNITYP